MGSIMHASQQIRRPEDVRTKEQLFPLAKEFIDQYYSSIKRQVHVDTGEPGVSDRVLGTKTSVSFQLRLCQQLNLDLSVRPLPATLAPTCFCWVFI